MHSVLDADKPDIDLGNMVLESVSNNAMFFTPELLMAKLVKDYRSAERLFGDRLVRQLTGYPPDYVERNSTIPEFRRHLQERIKQNFDELQEQGVIGADGAFTDDALELAAVSLAVQELEHLDARGLLGERVHKRRAVTGMREQTKPFVDEPYRSVSVQQSVKTALRRGHRSLRVEDLRAFEREAKGAANIIYAIDASGSMRGAKIMQAKRAGVALAWKAMSAGDKVGLCVFGKEVERSVPPGKDFRGILRSLAGLRTGSETDIAGVVRHAVTTFPRQEGANHLIILTDALPTIGSDPETDVLAAVAEARAAGIAVSVIGIGLDAKGEDLARQIVDVGDGRLSVVSDTDELDVIVLEEYDAIRRA